MKLLNILAQTNAPPDNASVAALLQEPTVSAALYYRGVGVTASWRAACGAGMAVVVVGRARGAARELAVAVEERKGMEGEVEREVEREVETARC